MMKLCMEERVPIIVDSDAHDPFWVGDFELAIPLIEEAGFDEELILNNDVNKLKAFLA